jgi:hypothetical protein
MKCILSDGARRLGRLDTKGTRKPTVFVDHSVTHPQRIKGIQRVTQY